MTKGALYGLLIGLVAFFIAVQLPGDVLSFLGAGVAGAVLGALLN